MPTFLAKGSQSQYCIPSATPEPARLCLLYNRRLRRSIATAHNLLQTMDGREAVFGAQNAIVLAH
jgi:hypothetical protein